MEVTEGAAEVLAMLHSTNDEGIQEAFDNLEKAGVLVPIHPLKVAFLPKEKIDVFDAEDAVESFLAMAPGGENYKITKKIKELNSQ